MHQVFHTYVDTLEKVRVNGDFYKIIVLEADKHPFFFLGFLELIHQAESRNDHHRRRQLLDHAVAQIADFLDSDEATRKSFHVAENYTAALKIIAAYRAVTRLGFMMGAKLTHAERTLD